jgi:lysophospholipase L1-like esterase
MTVRTLSHSTGPITGDGATTRFQFTFPVLDQAHIAVTKITSNALRQVLVRGSDYSLNLNPDQTDNPGGTIDYPGTNGALSRDESLLIERVVDLLQTTDLQSAATYNPELTEQALDKLTMMMQQMNRALMTSEAAKVAVLGSSEVVFPWRETWVDHINGALTAEAVNIAFYHTGAGAITHQLAMNKPDPLTGQTYVEFTSQSNPDVIIIELGVNDAILALGARTQVEMISDAQALYAYFRTHNPDALLIYSRLVPYDEERHSRVPVDKIKKKYCVPIMHQTSTRPGEEGLYTSEYDEVDKILPPLMQERLSDWKALDAVCRDLADVVINSSYFRPARLGLLSHDRYHPNSWGHYFIMSRVWEALQTNRVIRDALPELKKIRKLGDFTDFDLLWSSAIKLDVGKDGYDVDSKYLSGKEYPMWLNVYGDTSLINNIKYWANEQRPAIDLTETLDKSRDDLFLVMLNNLWPDQEIATKLWRADATEPSAWNRKSPPALISPTGSHISSVQNTALAAGSWRIKYRIGNDVFGPFDIDVSGEYPRAAKIIDIVTLIRTDEIQLLGEGWHNLPLTHVLAIREIDEAPNAVITNDADGAIIIAHDQDYSSFKVSGFCTVDAMAAGIYQLSFSRSPAGQLHDRGAGSGVIKSSDLPETLPLSFESLWLPIQTGGESLFLSLNTPGDVTIDGSRGIGVQIELR